MSFRGNCRGSRSVLTAVCFTLLLLGFALVMIPSESKGASHTKDIRGYVYDAQYRKVEGALVSVTIERAGNPVTRSGLTNADGYFNIQFSNTEWSPGRTVTVVATYNSEQTVNSTLVTDNSYFQWENATAFSFEIPQFGNAVGLLVTAGIVGVVAIRFLARRRP